MYKQRKHKGFTLLEILLVIAVIGILAAVVLVSINPNRQLAQARNSVRQADINTIQKALDQYLIDKGNYPNSISITPGYICNTGTEQAGGSTNCSGRVDLRELVPNYIAGIPKDPQATGINTGYIVAKNPNNDKISLTASLAEKKSIVSNSFIVKDGLVLNLDAGNPVSYPGTGTTWTDLSGNGNNGTLVNGVGYSSENGGSLVFDGIDDYVDLALVSSLPVGTTDRTVFSCVRTPTSLPESYLHVIHWGTANTSQSFGLAIFSNGGLNTHPWNGAPSQGTVVTGTNYCLSVSYTNLGALHKFWINGVAQGSGVSRSINTGISQARVGARISTPVEYWGPNGRIYNIMVYSRSLSDSEIQQNFNATRGRFGL